MRVMDFEEAYGTIVKASKEQDSIEIPTIISSVDFKDKECLEIGCGPLARLAVKISKNIDVKHITCLENYDLVVKKAKKAVDVAGLSDKISVQMYKNEDPYKLPFDDNSFDVVYGAWLPHDLVTDTGFLDEIARVSRKHVLLIVSGIDDDLVKMKSIVFPGEKERREGSKKQVSEYLKNKGFKIDYKDAVLKLDFKNFDEIAGVFYFFDFKNEDIGDNKEDVDKFLKAKIHNLKNSFYCLHGEK